MTSPYELFLVCAGLYRLKAKLAVFPPIRFGALHVWIMLCLKNDRGVNDEKSSRHIFLKMPR